MRIFIPFFIYLILSMTYFYIAVDDKYAHEAIFLVNEWEFWNRNLIILFSLYFLVFELIQLRYQKLTYLKDTFNWLFIFALTLNILISVSYGYKMNFIPGDHMFGWTAVAVLLMWINSLYWLRFFETTATVIKTIQTAAGDIKPLILVGVLIGITFSSSMFYLNYRPLVEGRTFSSDDGL